MPCRSKLSSSGVQKSRVPDCDRAFLPLEPWVPDKRSNAFFTGVEADFFESAALALGVELNKVFGLGSFPDFAFDFVETGALLTGACIGKVDVSSVPS